MLQIQLVTTTSIAMGGNDFLGDCLERTLVGDVLSRPAPRPLCIELLP